MPPTKLSTTAVVLLPCGWIDRQLVRKMIGFATSMGNHHIAMGLSVNRDEYWRKH
jgi:hypothetical protein